MDGHRPGPRKRTGEQNPAYRSAHRLHRLNSGLALYCRRPSGSGTVEDRLWRASKSSARPLSALVAVRSYFESCADRPQTLATQPAEPLNQHGNRHALDRVQIDRATPRHRVLARFQHHLAGQPPDRGRARPDQRSTQPPDGGIAREDHNRSASGVGQLAPPQLPACRKRAHDAAAASRKAARSPHSSASWSGRASYAE